ncbi:MAG: lysozyme inhibitor [Rhodobacterales bacterium]|nr:MAG: lysozyme inhibitor [Rhodobacterales bacterium]
MKHVKPLCAALVLTAGSALAQDEGTSMPWATAISYECERGARIDVMFINTDHGESYAIAQIEGQLVAMTIEISASGARYVEDASGYVLWTKGDEASLFHGPDETPLYLECRSR